MLAALALKGVYPDAETLGNNALGEGVSVGSGLLVEIVLTAVFLFVIVSVATDVRVTPGFAAPPVLHHHVDDDVTMLVLDGTLVVTGVDGEVVAGPGEVVQLPHGTPFAWRNGSADLPMTYLAVYAPGGFEAYFVAVADALADGRALGPELLHPLWARFGIAVSQV